MTARILAIEHESDDPAALMGQWLSEAGCEVVPCRPYAGDALPDLAGYDALLVMGGAMGANDDATVAWLAPTKQLIRDAATAGLPTLGICLGHQLAAVALGGTVEVNPLGRQLGLHDVGWTPDAASDELFGGLVSPRPAVHFNDDVVTTLPPDAVLLARAERGEVQAARHAPSVWGIQWHPEVDEPLVRAWTAEEGLVPSEDVEPVLSAIGAAADELEAAWRPLAQRFADLARG